MHSRSVRSLIGVSLVSLVTGMGLGCTGGAKEPELAPTPPGVELLKPGPTPKDDPSLKGSSAADAK